MLIFCKVISAYSEEIGYILTNNFTNCYVDIPVVFEYLSRNQTAFLTTDLILRPTSRRIDCKDIKSRYLF
jgi:hypothetical protein